MVEDVRLSRALVWSGVREQAAKLVAQVLSRGWSKVNSGQSAVLRARRFDESRKLHVNR
jgi:hypothetical protein